MTISKVVAGGDESAAQQDILGETRLTLGDIEFKNDELPQSIETSLQQRLVDHELVGGGRVVDSMGSFYEPVSWSGSLTGLTAVERDQTLRALASGAKEWLLSWDVYRYRVVVANYHSIYRDHAHIDYTLRCTVLDSVSDEPAEDEPDSSREVVEAVGEAQALAGESGDSTIMAAAKNLQEAIGTAHDLASAGLAKAQSIVSELVSVQQVVKERITTLEKGVMTVATLGGVLPGNPVARAAQEMTERLDAAVALPGLYRLQDTLTGAGKKLELLPVFAAKVGTVAASLSKAEAKAGQALKTITQTAGDLYDVAARELGDVTLWPLLAQANHLDDPVLPEGVNTIRIPPVPVGPFRHPDARFPL